MSAKVLAFPTPKSPSQEAAEATLAQVKGAFPGLIKEPQAINPGSPGGQGPAMGPYAMPIYYLANGRERHTAGEAIDEKRSVRHFSLNALELRCDALGLAVYLAGKSQIMDNLTLKHGVQVAAYDFRNEKPTSTATVGNPEDLHATLHKILLDTYNRLAREFNLAGLSQKHLVLKSTNAKFPDIHLIP